VKHVTLHPMKTITVRDLRQRWPQAEALLNEGQELVITRDGQPVARLVRIASIKARRKRFEPAEQAAWQRRVFGKRRVSGWVDRTLARTRAERLLGS